MSYKSYLKSKDWKKKRNNKLNKSQKRCGVCMSINNLEVHHLSYKNLHDVKTSDLRIFCAGCHTITHYLLKEGVIKYREDSHHHRFALTRHHVNKFRHTPIGRKAWKLSHIRAKDRKNDFVMEKTLKSRENVLDNEFKQRSEGKT